MRTISDRLTGFGNPQSPGIDTIDQMVAERKILDVSGNESIVTRNILRGVSRLQVHIQSPAFLNQGKVTHINGRVVEEVTPEQVETDTYYDSLGRVEKVVDLRKNDPRISNYTSGTTEVASVTERSQLVEKFTYDDAGRVSKVEKLVVGGPPSEYAETNRSYDPQGRLIKEWGSGARPIRYEYDTLYGDLKEQHTFPTGSQWEEETWPVLANEGHASIVRWKYDSSTGLAKEKTDPSNQETEFWFNQRGQIWKRNDARNNVKILTYDNATGRLSTIDYSDASGATPDIKFAYNRIGQITGVTDGVLSAGDITGSNIRTHTAYTYTTEMQLDTEVLDATFYGPRTVDYGYSGGAGKAKGRLTDVILKDASTDLLKSTLAYENATGVAGRVEKITSESRDFTYGYLDNSNLVESLITDGNAGFQVTTTRNWVGNRDLLFNIETWVYGEPNEFSKNTFAYDELGRKTNITKRGTRYNSYGGGIGRIRWFDYNLRGDIEQCFDEQGEVINDPNNVLLPGRSCTYGYDNAGNRSSITFDAHPPLNYISDPTGTNELDQRQNPDYVPVSGSADAGSAVIACGPVDEVTGDLTIAETTQVGEYYYAEVPINENGDPEFCTVDVFAGIPDGGSQSNDLISVDNRYESHPGTTETFSYDADGSLTRSGLWEFAYDAENRLTSMWMRDDLPPMPAGQKRLKLEFEYDYRWRRIEKVVSEWDGSQWVAGPARRFIYHGWNLIAEQEGTNLPDRKYVWGLDASGTLQGAGGVAGLLMIIDDNENKTLFPAYDGSGNVMALLKEGTPDEPDAVYEYGAFGERQDIWGDYAKQNPFRFSTKYTDPETGLIYFGFRYYAPSLGRFLTRDPIGEHGGENLYLLAENDPVNSLDFLGLNSHGNPDNGDSDREPPDHTPFPISSPILNGGTDELLDNSNLVSEILNIALPFNLDRLPATASNRGTSADARIGAPAQRRQTAPGVTVNTAVLAILGGEASVRREGSAQNRAYDRLGQGARATLGIVTNTLGIIVSAGLAGVPDITVSKVAAVVLATKSSYGVAANGRNLMLAILGEDPDSKGALTNDLADLLAPGNQNLQHLAAMVDLSIDLASGNVARRGATQFDLVKHPEIYGLEYTVPKYVVLLDPNNLGTTATLFQLTAIGGQLIDLSVSVSNQEDE